MRLTPLTFSALATAFLASLNATGFVTIPWLYVATPLLIPITLFALQAALILAVVVLGLIASYAIYRHHNGDTDAAKEEMESLIATLREWLQRHTPAPRD